MDNNTTSSNKGLIWGLIAIIVIIAGIVYFMHSSTTVDTGMSTTTTQQACTMEAKICPDGSSVGRTGPNCEFAACPDTATSTGTKTFIDSANNVTFNYPGTLGTTYVSTVDWPPTVQVLAGAQACTAAGSATSTAGVTKTKVVNGRTYCVTLETEGAAGSTYYTYAYAFPKGTKTVILTFSLREPQCANYDEPNQSACKAEQAGFNVDQTVDKIAQSLTLGA